MYHHAVRRSLLGAVSHKPCTPSQQQLSQWVRHASSSSPKSPPPRNPRGGALKMLSILVIGAGAGYYFYSVPDGTKAASSKVPRSSIPQAEIEFEETRKNPKDGGDLGSSQHLQVKKSWENLGVYVWGSNSGRVAAPESAESVVKTPRRIPWFDGKLLRDLKLDRNFGVAVTEEGDVVQWGAAFSPDAATPLPTLTGKDIAKVAISCDSILALSRSGTVYTFPVSKADQQAGAKSRESSSWLPFWSSGTPAVSYRTVKPDALAWGEKIVDVSSGLEHCLLLTSSGRVFSAASSTENFPSKGQLGIPGLSWRTRTPGRYDQPYEVKGLPSAGIAQVATGNHHSLALDKEARVFAWGDNSSGQLGFAVDSQSPTVDAPTEVPLATTLYGREARPSVTSIAAGGSNSYFAVDSVAGARAVADVWACGAGITGSLGNGKWTHVSSGPTLIKTLSGLSEYDEATRRVVPIRLGSLSVGSTHVAATMSNVASVGGDGSSSSSSSSSGTNNTETPSLWGADVFWWGSNEFYQLGNGKRSNLSEPAYIPALDSAPGAKGGASPRFQLTPRATVRLGEGGKGRKVCLEQRVECGRYVTAVYSAVAQ